MSGIQNDHLRSYSQLQPKIRRKIRLGDAGGGCGYPEWFSRIQKESFQLQYLISMKTI